VEAEVIGHYWILSIVAFGTILFIVELKRKQ